MAIDAKFVQWPSQKISDRNKTEDWGKQNIDAAISSMAFDTVSGVRETRRNKIINYNLANNILDRSEVERTVNPFNIQGYEYPTELNNYPIVMPKIDILVGEELKMSYTPIAKVINQTAISEKEQEKKNAYLQFVAEQIANPNYDEAQAKAAKERLDIWAAYEYQDVRERMANDLLSYFVTALDMPTQFNKGYLDLNIAGEEMYLIDLYAGEPYVEKLNPVAVTTHRMGTSWKIEDADAITIDGYYPIGWIIDHFYDKLKDADVRALNAAVTKSGTTTSVLNMAYNPSPQRELSVSGLFGVDSSNQISGSALVGTYFGGAYDAHGNARVIRVYWKSMRRIGVKFWFDEYGVLNREIVPDGYVVQKELGERVTWYWVNEWWKGAKIADDIYVDISPWEGNKYGMDNFQLRTSPIVGSVLNINTSKAMSLMDRAKPYQYMYNSLMYRNWKGIAKSWKASSINVAMLPEGMGMDQIIYYATEMGFIPYNPFEEGKKGESIGKLAGTYNQPPAAVDSDQSNIIQMGISMCQFLEEKISEITGVTPQRQGAIEQRELVGNVQRSVVQSSLSTSYQLAVHFNTKDRVCTNLLEIAKIAYKGKKFKRSYILSDMSEKILDFDGDKFCEAEYGIFTVNAASEDRVGNLLQEVAGSVAKNDLSTLSAMVDIMETKSPADRRRKFELFSLKQREAAQAEGQMQQEMAQKQLEETMFLNREKLRIEEEDNIRKADTALEVAAMQLQGKQMDIDANDNGIPDAIDIQKVELEREKLNVSREDSVRKAMLEKEKIAAAREKAQLDAETKKYVANKKPKSTK